tara:strand:+ start:2327 stop:2584 length:258 start_codon:yes stop_codon:yes gene_type:complete
MSQFTDVKSLVQRAATKHQSLVDAKTNFRNANVSLNVGKASAEVNVPLKNIDKSSMHVTYKPRENVTFFGDLSAKYFGGGVNIKY